MTAKTHLLISILRLTPLFGIEALIMGLIFQNFVNSVQPNGLGESSYPLQGLGLVLEFAGIGIIVFGAFFNFTKIESIGVERATVSSFFVGTGSSLS